MVRIRKWINKLLPIFSAHKIEHNPESPNKERTEPSNTSNKLMLHGDKLMLHGAADDKSIDAMINYASVHWNGMLQIDSATPDVQRKLWMKAKQANMTVLGYTPSIEDIRAYERLTASVTPPHITKKPANASTRAKKDDVKILLNDNSYLIDSGNKLVLHGDVDDKSIDAMINHASVHWNGMLQIDSATPDVQRKLWMKAKQANMTVLGYTPSIEDIKDYEQLTASVTPPHIIKKSAKTSTPLSVDTPESEYPQSIWDMYHKAFKIFNDRQKTGQPLTDADVNTILDLYRQTGFTSPPRTWVGLLAEIYDSANHSFTDHKKAHALRVEAAKISSLAADNLGTLHAFPTENSFPPEPARAIFWWLRAFYAGQDESGVKALQLIAENDTLKTLRPHLPTLFLEVERRYNTSSNHRPQIDLILARAYQSGRHGVTKNPAKVDEYYKRIVYNAESSPFFIRLATAALATRSVLGIGQDFDPRQAAAYATQLLSACHSTDADHVLHRYKAQRILHLMKPFVGEVAASTEQIAEMQSISKLAQDIIAKKLSPAQLKSEIATRARKTTYTLEGCLWLLVTYMINELTWPQDDLDVFECIKQAQQLLLGDKAIGRIENHFQYNRLDQRGAPIIGDLVPLREPTSVDDWHQTAGETLGRENGQHEQTSINGAGRFRGIDISSEGVLSFLFDPVDATTGGHPLIVSEDIQVALALAFAEEKPIWPWFSFEAAATLSSTEPLWEFHQPVWGPSWIANTTLGNTLCAVDVEGIEVIHTIEKRTIATRANTDESNKWLEQLRLVIGEMARERVNTKSKIGDYSFFEIAAAEITWSSSPNSQHRCDVGRTDIALRRGKADENDQRKSNQGSRETVNLDDDVFNRNFDLFAQHYPLLERYRQLATLVIVLNQLRERGYNPDPLLQKTIESSHTALSQRPLPTWSRQLFSGSYSWDV